jgi:hypothetical protein
VTLHSTLNGAPPIAASKSATPDGVGGWRRTLAPARRQRWALASSNNVEGYFSERRSSRMPEGGIGGEALQVLGQLGNRHESLVRGAV